MAGELDGPPAAFMAPKRPAEELYDTDADPWEIDNVAGDPANREVLERHRAALDEWQRDVGDLGMVNEPAMVQAMWPGRRQPATIEPTFTVYNATEIGNDPSPEGGEFDGPVLIQLQSTTQGASIGWTTDDAEEPNWLVYHEPIRLEPGETVTLRALAHRIGFTPSDQVSATFTIR